MEYKYEVCGITEIVSPVVIYNLEQMLHFDKTPLVTRNHDYLQLQYSYRYMTG